MNIRIFENSEALSEAAAARILELLNNIEGVFDLVLSGGSTPKKLYAMMAAPAYRESIDWGRLRIWWGDERFVPPSDKDSNEGMARTAMLNHVPVKSENVHPMYRFGTASEAATAYEQELRSELVTKRLDLVLLGLGPDAHTASLFPGDPSIHEEKRCVVASEGAAGVKQRLTLTPPIINAAKEVLFLVAGADKRDPLRHVLNELYEPDRYPAQVIARNASRVQWYLDKEAAEGL